MSRISFQAKLFIHYVLLASAILGIVCGMFFFLVWPKLNGAVYAGLEKQSSDAKDRIEQFLSDDFRNVRAIGDNPVLKSGFSNAEKSEMLSLMQSIYTIYDEISLVGIGGEVFASTSGSPGKSWGGDNYFLNSLSGRVAVSDVRKKDESTYVFWTFSPVFDKEKNIIFVVAAETPMNSLWKITDSAKIGGSGFVFVIDDSGRLVSHPDKALILKNPPYSFGYKKLLVSGAEEFDGLVGGYSKSIGGDYHTGWIVFAVQQKTEALQALNPIINGFAAVIAVSFFAAILGSFLLARKDSKPVSDLRDGIKKIMSGEIGYEISAGAGGEIGEIADSIKEMSGKMKERELLERMKGNMQSKVKELEKLNNLLVGREKEITKLKRRLGEK